MDPGKQHSRIKEKLPVYDLTICIARTGALELGDAINHSLLE